MSPSTPCRSGARWRLVVSGALALAAVAAGLASAQDLQSELEHKRDRLAEVKRHEGVLSTTIQRYGERIDRLIGEVSVLRNREALVAARLRRKQAELHADRARLARLRIDLEHSLHVLRNRLVDIYESGGEPDALTVILDANGFDDLINRYEYLRRISDQDAAVVGRVRGLRDDMRTTVERVSGERDEIAARRDELERTRTELENRQGALHAARSRQRRALARVKDTKHELDGDVSEIQDRIQAQIAAAQANGGVAAAPAGPVRGESSEGLIWPVNGPVVSPFGPRTINGAYENHPGIDIAVPSGTAISAAADGVVILTQSEAESGGYGNYTCIDHGGGLATCYAHQSSFSVSQGERVSQGQVIGISDCTGYCFGPHLHFEVRIDGQVTDPIPYLP
jgi:peptidoglycan DL-endopeptidase CwlO